MKNLDLLSKRIAVISTSICGILLFASLFMFSISNLSKSYASDSKPMYPTTNNTTVGVGQIMMAFQVLQAGDGNWYKELLVWNTETGKSKFYSDMKVSDQLPAKPIE